MSRKESELITRLIDLTRQGKLTWQRKNAPDLTRPDGERFVDLVYLSHVDGDIFRVSRILVRCYKDFADFDWEDDTALELVDEQGRILWRCPKHFAVTHLLQAIEEKNVNLDVLIGKLARMAS